MDFTPHTDTERKEMLAAIGVENLSTLLASLPLSQKEIKIPSGLAEGEVLRHLHDLATQNLAPAKILSFLGAGAYEHFSPAAIGALTSRGEFLTSYTPYQPEVSQGTLQAIYEFQSLVCELMAMDVANASMYDASTALAEAVLLALRETGRRDILVPQTLHPDYRAVLATYTAEMSARIIDIPHRDGLLDLDFLAQHAGEQTAAVIVQNPNFFGLVEPVQALKPVTDRCGALLIACVNPLALGVLTPPGQFGADIAVAEGQPLGIPLGYGGPYVGLFACQSRWMRKMPGRLVGQTTDVDGKRAFVLTLQAREQHIRREKATSNICSNEALVALGNTVYLSLVGREGLREVATQNLAKSHYAFAQLTQIPGVRSVFRGPFFNEFVLQTKKPAEQIQRDLLARNILGGLPLKRWFPLLENASLWCVTETKSKEDIDHLARTLKEVL